MLIRVEQQPGGEVEQQAALKKVLEALSGQYTQRRSIGQQRRPHGRSNLGQ